MLPTEAKTGRTATVPICVKCRNRRGERGRHGREALVYACWGYRPGSPDAVFTTTPLNMQMFYCDPPDLEDIICFGECLGGERLLAL